MGWINQNERGRLNGKWGRLNASLGANMPYQGRFGAD